MKTVELADATGSLSQYARLARRGTVVVTRRGQPFAAVVALDPEDAASDALSRHPEFIAIIERSRERQRTEGGLSIDEVRRRLKIPRKPTARRAG